MPRDRRLKRRRLIRPLFRRDRVGVGRVSEGVVHLSWRLVPRTEIGADSPLQVGFAPGRGTRTKVVRNRLRRVMREEWRINQGRLLEETSVAPDHTLTVFVLFRGNYDRAETDIRRDLPAAMARLAHRLSAEHGRTADAQ
jgi:ribonuclease P protein component